MPRGFLVKRSKKASVSYRIRTDQEDELLCKALSKPSETQMIVYPYNPASAFQENGLNWYSSAFSIASQPAAAKKDSPAFVSDPPNPTVNILQSENSEEISGSCSPMKPIATELKNDLLERCLRSPVSAESFPISPSFSPIEKILMHHPPFSTPEMKRENTVHLCSSLQMMKRPLKEPGDRRSKPVTKKQKVIKKLNFEDEVTTSPVLGLKIKEADPNSKPRPTHSRPPLGEFICQLCKEEYPDPFSLAQHKCSRIVRVEYRCPECDKVFSCPANLASHRRWHKPRPGTTAESQNHKKQQLPTITDHVNVSIEGKENSSKPLASDYQQESKGSSHCPDQHHHTMNSSQHLHENCKTVDNVQLLDQHHVTVNSSNLLDQNNKPTENSQYQDRRPTVSTLTSMQGGTEDFFECPYCCKKFRRQAYLRKHLAAHEVTRPMSYSQPDRRQLTFPCHLCGAHFPSAEIRDKHRVWHTVKEEILINHGKESSSLESHDSGQGENQIFSCKHCPSTFFSSPGLTRHINKCHPTENRQVLLLHMPVRPAC
ncbi:insulinoma-associated protein 1 [Latimeria chalumnae]|uniref:insulinoma-associated protein 1 n=1 Tax=Latimeria chalumnae TaxID=7897 RepID=UPI0003C17AC1|nr:PREDICTED: insulinoma-associated protein 2 [Latimeria chalumnae]|eukprot:XP_005989265.1 PREDICTED: insulinoma-associated protein 2 [Latimeria chalumnae]